MSQILRYYLIMSLMSARMQGHSLKDVPQGTSGIRRIIFQIEVAIRAIRNLEQISKGCDSAFKAIKSEWSFQVEQLTGTINSLWTELENKTAVVKELEKELESSHSSTSEMMLLNEELSVMLLVYQQGVSETQLNISKELDGHNEMLEESTKYKLLPKEKVLHMEFDLEEKLREVGDALDKAIIELSDTIHERNEMELQLQVWMLYVERLRKDLEENFVMGKRLENSLLAQVVFSESLKQENDKLVLKLEEKENRISCLQHYNLLEMIEEKNKILEELKKEVVWLEQESFRREVESHVVTEIKMEKTNELEKENHMKGENMRIDEVMPQLTTLEKHCTSYLTSISSQLDEKQDEIKQVQEACDKIKAVALESKKIKMENRNLHENATRLSSENENLLIFVRLLYDKMCDSTTADTEIMDMLNNFVHSFENNDPVMNLIKGNEFLVEENMIIHSPRRTKKHDTCKVTIYGA
ncbi:hypothetical protein TanjilG_25546 [Lupinus angustifolius]|uniref:Uncharacterized protein n=1 Tax=Lupinus angustifolius TaxID=3871 RepID=A0A4P1QT82_LUPAN|nr:hypothetical protein TanjilG_25546 [Lupinus angustifolius]